MLPGLCDYFYSLFSFFIYLNFSFNPFILSYFYFFLFFSLIFISLSLMFFTYFQHSCVKLFRSLCKESLWVSLSSSSLFLFSSLARILRQEVTKQIPITIPSSEHKNKNTNTNAGSMFLLTGIGER